MMNKKKFVFKICLECGKKYELTNKIHSHFICSEVCREKNKEKKKKYRTKSRAYEKSFKTGLKNKVKLYSSLYSPIMFIAGFIFLLAGILLGSPFFVTIHILGNILVSYWLLSKYEILNYAKAYFYLNICHILMMFGFISEMFKGDEK